MSKRPIKTRDERVYRDPVTHEIVRIRLDAVELARQRVHAEIDRVMMPLTPAECERLARELVEMCRGMVPHTD